MTLNCSFLLQVVKKNLFCLNYTYPPSPTHITHLLPLIINKSKVYFPDSRNVYRKSNLLDATMAPRNNIIAIATTIPCETSHLDDLSKTQIHSNGTKAKNNASPNNTTVVPKLR
jgi:hypothetical protein